MSERKRVLVTAIGGGGFGDQVVKALRLADRYFVIGADMNPRVPQFRWVDQALALPPASHSEYVEATLAECVRRGVQALIPGSESELIIWSRERAQAGAHGILLPIASRSVIDIAMDKRRTSEFLRDAGFDAPAWATIRADSDLNGVERFPVVVKPAVGGGGSRDTYLAQTRRELALIHELVTANGSPMIVQEYVGTPDHEYTVGVLHDLDGGFVNSIAVRRHLKGAMAVRLSIPNRSGRAELGSHLIVSSGISTGDVGPYPEVASQCEEIAAALDLRGAANFQCRLVNGMVMVFEINPRFSGTTSIRALMGYNEPDALLRRHLDGEELQVRFPYRTGTVLRTINEVEAPGSDAPRWRLS